MASEEALNIGNLILLEYALNNVAGSDEYEIKKQIYSKSKYSWVQEFVYQHNSWTADEIKKRAEDMASIYYYKILKRK